MSEQENNTQEQEAPAKGKKNFGNTIVLFIVFFIIFTILVTGVAFFADKIKGGKKEAKVTEEQMKEQMTDPEKGKQEAYVIDDKGNVAKQDGEAKAPEQPATETAPVEPQEPVKAPEPVAPKVEKPAEAPKAAVKKEAPKPVTKPVEQKPVVKSEAPKPAVKAEAPKTEAPKAVIKTAPKTETPKATTAVKVTPVIPGDYHVQLASFKNLEIAEEEYHRWRGKISDLQLVKVDLGEKGIWYRLRCGTALSRESAKARAAQIADITGYKPDIMK